MSANPLDQKRILLVSPSPPFPPENGANQRTYLLWKALSEIARVDVIHCDDITFESTARVGPPESQALQDLDICPRSSPKQLDYGKCKPLGSSFKFFFHPRSAFNPNPQSAIRNCTLMNGGLRNADCGLEENQAEQFRNSRFHLKKELEARSPVRNPQSAISFMLAYSWQAAEQLNHVEKPCGISSSELTKNRFDQFRNSQSAIRNFFYV